jgi:hypothetical protein
MSAHRQHVARALRRRGLSRHSAASTQTQLATHSIARSSLDELALGAGGDEFRLWLPQPDEPIVLASFAEVVSFALEVADLPVEREVMVLLDHHRRMTALLLDPPLPLGVLIGRADIPGLDVPFSHTLSIVVTDHVENAPPDERHRIGYHSLRRIHMTQGLTLLDIVLTDGDAVQSLAFACDPDPIWLEPFWNEQVGDEPFRDDPFEDE